MRRTLTGTALVLVASMLGGCSHQIENPGKVLPGSPDVEQTRSGELHRLQFADIPVPSGFELVTRGNRSFSFQGGGVRVAGYRYWGKSSPEKVAAFYRRNMPLRPYGWSPGIEKNEQGNPVLEFKKEQDTCRISIQPDDDATVVLMEVAGR